MKAVTPKLPKKLKEIKVNNALLHEVVDVMLSNRRFAKACTKTRSEVSGGGKKPWRQKGTGRARVGSNRSPIWKGGGVIFGPTRKQSYNRGIPRKKKQLAVLQMIVQRINEKNLKVVDSIEFAEPKTKLAAGLLKDIFGEEYNKVLVLVEGKNQDICRSFRNISNVTVSEWNNMNTYSLLAHDKILFDKNAWKNFIAAKGLNE